MSPEPFNQANCPKYYNSNLFQDPAEAKRMKRTVRWMKSRNRSRSYSKMLQLLNFNSKELELLNFNLSKQLGGIADRLTAGLSPYFERALRSDGEDEEEPDDEMGEVPESKRVKARTKSEPIYLQKTPRIFEDDIRCVFPAQHGSRIDIEAPRGTRDQFQSREAIVRLKSCSNVTHDEEPDELKSDDSVAVSQELIPSYNAAYTESKAKVDQLMVALRRFVYLRKQSESRSAHAPHTADRNHETKSDSISPETASTESRDQPASESKSCQTDAQIATVLVAGRSECGNTTFCEVSG